MAKGYLTEDNLVPWLQSFVRFPSQQSGLLEADPEVKAFVHRCTAPVLEQIGAPYCYDPMGNLIVDVGPRDTGRSVMFVCYAMTHPATNMSDPFSADVVGSPRGKAVRGRGVAEQKTALTAALGALATALGGKLGGRLIFALTTAGETGRHDAVESVMRTVSKVPTCAVVCIGTDSRIAIGNKGRVDFDVIIKGKTAHSSVPWNGINAISGARRVLDQMEGFDLGVPDHPTFGPATLTATAIDSSPKATHTVPDTVRITFDRRLLPGEDPQSAYEAVRRAIVLEQPWQLECRRGPIMYPNEVSPDGPLVENLKTAFALAGQPNPEMFYCNFALDAGYLSRMGVETVMLGPGEVDQFHSNEEHVLVSDLVGMARVYYHLIDRCLASTR